MSRSRTKRQAERGRGTIHPSHALGHPRPPRVVVDACVLHAVFIRDLLMHFACMGFMTPLWTARIEEEWMESVRRRHPSIDRSRLQAVAHHMRSILPASYLPGTLETPAWLRPHLQGLPDPKDAHVVVAAIIGGADSICTFDRRGFPPRLLGPLGVRTISPDDLIVGFIQHGKIDSIAPVRGHRAALRSPPVSAADYTSMASANRLPRTTAILHRMQAHI